MSRRKRTTICFDSRLCWSICVGVICVGLTFDAKCWDLCVFETVCWWFFNADFCVFETVGWSFSNNDFCVFETVGWSFSNHDFCVLETVDAMLDDTRYYDHTRHDSLLFSHRRWWLSLWGGGVKDSNDFSLIYCWNIWNRPPPLWRLREADYRWNVWNRPPPVWTLRKAHCAGKLEIESAKSTKIPRSKHQKSKIISLICHLWNHFRKSSNRNHSFKL